jgi:hypothetical protein
MLELLALEDSGRTCFYEEILGVTLGELKFDPNYKLFSVYVRFSVRFLTFSNCLRSAFRRAILDVTVVVGRTWEGRDWLLRLLDSPRICRRRFRASISRSI